MPLISIIVPVYNSQLFLNNCLDSLIKQSYNNIEIILVDDGSTDSSAEICDEYATIDNRIKVIHKTNEGVSCARNTGLDNCKGDYIAFVDSDDCVEKDYIETMYERMVFDNVDIVICNYDIIDDNNGFCYNHCFNINGVYNTNSFLANYLSLNIETDECWGKLYKASVLSNVRFEKYYMAEDSLFVFECLTNSKSVSILNEKLYHYRIVNSSIMRLADSSKYYDSCKVALKMLEWCTLYSDDTLVIAASHRMIKMTFFVLFIALNDENYEVVNKCERYIKNNRMKCIFSKEHSLKIKMACLVSFFGRRGLLLVYKLVKNTENKRIDQQFERI